VTEDGVQVEYKESTLSTGVCLAILTSQDDSQRSQIFHGGASEIFQVENLQENSNSLESSRYFFVEAAFIGISLDSVKYLASYCANNNKIFILNLSAESVVLNFKNEILHLLKYTDIVFGKWKEFQALGTLFNLKEISEIADKIIGMDYVFKKASDSCGDTGCQTNTCISTWKNTRIQCGASS